MTTRRTFLRACGAALGGGLLAQAASADHFDEYQPSHVTIEYDEDYLTKYQPHLKLSYDTQEKFIGFYGWVASSPERETNCCVYWASYSHQEGWLGNLDSHYGDHEPVAVEVDKESGDVVRVRGSIYHWLKGEQLADAVPMDGTNPQLRVIDPWHQYTAATPEDVTQELAVEDLTGTYSEWLANGLEQDLLPGASTNPWKMRYEGDYWRDGVGGVSVNSILVRAAKTGGIDTVGSLSR